MGLTTGIPPISRGQVASLGGRKDGRSESLSKFLLRLRLNFHVHDSRPARTGLLGAFS